VPADEQEFFTIREDGRPLFDEEASDGSFNLRLFNDTPCGADVPPGGMNKQL
jgi:hypothetical protein